MAIDEIRNKFILINNLYIFSAKTGPAILIWPLNQFIHTHRHPHKLIHNYEKYKKYFLGSEMLIVSEAIQKMPYICSKFSSSNRLTTSRMQNPHNLQREY